MNAAFVMLTSAWLAGADPVPATPPAAAAAPAPAVVATGSSCAGGCGSSCDSCGDACCESGKKKRLGGFFGKIKGKFGKKGGDCCEAAPVCCEAPKPVCCPAPKPVCCEAPKPVCCPAPKPVCCEPAPTCCDDPCAKAPRQGFLSKIKGKFGKKGGDDCCATTGGCDACTSGCGGGVITPAPSTAPATPAPAAEPKKMPTTIGGTPAVITPAKIGSESRNPFDLARRYHGKAQASADYSKLTGQLFFVHTDGGRWVVRYAPISQEDRFGGSVVLSRDINMDAFNEGDLLNVEGAVLADRSNVRLGGALYRASRVSLAERGQGTIDQ